jgi:hypothetical protein
MADLSFIDLGDYAELPDAYIAEAGSTFVNKQISLIRTWIYDQLRRQYDVAAMVTTEPETVKKWIGEIIVPKIYRKRGVDPTDLQYQEFVAQAKAARADVSDAANAEKGLFDLPAATTGVAAKKNMQTLTKSEADPGSFKSRQAERAYCEREQRWQRSY